MKLRKLINYYKECYREDSADFNLRNLQKLAKEDLRILNGNDSSRLQKYLAKFGLGWTDI